MKSLFALFVGLLSLAVYADKPVMGKGLYENKWNPDHKWVMTQVNFDNLSMNVNVVNDGVQAVVKVSDIICAHRYGRLTQFNYVSVHGSMYGERVNGYYNKTMRLSTYPDSVYPFIQEVSQAVNKFCYQDDLRWEEYGGMVRYWKWMRSGITPFSTEEEIEALRPHLK